MHKELHYLHTITLTAQPSFGLHRRPSVSPPPSEHHAMRAWPLLRNCPTRSYHISLGIYILIVQNVIYHSPSQLHRSVIWR